MNEQLQVIGLTGGVASGKSAAAQVLREFGETVVDADQLAREAVVPGSSGLERIVDRFGSGILDSNGALDRAKLREHAFSNPKHRQDLEAILHPWIAARAQEIFAELAKQGKKRVFYEIPLLFEVGRAKDFKEILVIFCSPNTQRLRLKARDPKISDDTIEQILKAQWSAEDRLKHATWSIENEGTVAALRDALGRWLVSLDGAKRKPKPLKRRMN